MLAKAKLNSIQVLFSKALNVSNIGHDELSFVLIYNAWKEYDDMKEEINNFKNLWFI